MIEKTQLEKLYLEDKASMMEIAQSLNCSIRKIAYWMDKYGILRRTISDAIYQKHNPLGDPFTVMPVRTKSDAKLMGLGLGLYWGEGNKANKTAVRMGNTDAELLKTFIDFLVRLFGIKKEDLHFSLQIFTDIDLAVALAYWTRKLGVQQSQFYKSTVTVSGSIGTYRKKSEYGVVTVDYHNKKLRDILVGMLPR